MGTESSQNGHDWGGCVAFPISSAIVACGLSPVEVRVVVHQVLSFRHATVQCQRLW